MAHTRVAALSEYWPLRINAGASTQTPIGSNIVATTAPTTITAGANVVVTPASMQGIVLGMWLNFAGGTGTTEDVLVKSINPVLGTFTADFLFAHSGAYNISSWARGTDLGMLLVGKAGSANAVLTIFNGNANVRSVATGSTQILGTVAHVVTNPTVDKILGLTLAYGAFYTLTGTTIPDLTVTYLEHAV